MAKKFEENIEKTFGALPADPYQYILKMLEHTDLYHLSLSNRFFSQPSKDPSSVKTPVMQGLLEKKTLYEAEGPIPSLLDVCKKVGFTPNFTTEFRRLATAAPTVFRELFDLNHAAVWMVAAIYDKSSIVESCLDQKNADSIRVSSYQASVAQILLMAGAWDTLVSLLNKKIITTESLLENRGDILFAAIGGLGDYQDSLRNLAEKRDPKSNEYIIADENVRKALANITMDQDQKLLFAYHLMQFGYAKESLEFLIKSKVGGIQVLKEKHPATHLQAAANNHWGVCDWLVSKCQFDPRIADDQGRTLFHFAAVTKRKDKFLALLAKERTRERAKAQDKNQLTPLDYAILSGSVFMLETCILQNLGEIENRGQEPIRLAIRSKNLHMLKYVVSKIPMTTNELIQQLFQAAEVGNWTAVEYLYQNYADPSSNLDLLTIQNLEGHTLREVASSNHQTHFIHSLERFGESKSTPSGSL